MKNTTCCRSQVSPRRTVLSWTASTRHRADLCRAGVGQSAWGPLEAGSGGLGSPTPPQCGSDLSTAGGPLQQGGSGGRPAPSRSPDRSFFPPRPALEVGVRPSCTTSGQVACPCMARGSGRSQACPPLLPAPRPFHWPSCYRTAGQGWPVSWMVGQGRPLSRQRAQALPSPGWQGRGSLSPGWGCPQAPWPSRRPAVSLTVCCDARPTQREKAESVPHSGLTEPCLPTSSQSPEGS